MDDGRGRNCAAVKNPGSKNFPEAVRAHRPAVITHCYRMLGSLQDAEDVAQEVLTRAWRNTGSFEGQASMRTWLLRIATNACLDELRARRRRLLPVDSRRSSDP